MVQQITKPEIPEISIIKDVLDNQLVDRSGKKMGRVDGVVIEVHADGPPRLAYIEAGGPALAARFNRRIGAWLVRFARRLGWAGEPYRIPWEKVVEMGIDVRVDLNADETPLLALDRWLSRHFIGRIPGSGA